MKKAICIGFEYNGEKRLPGIAVDLYLAYRFLKNNGWQDSQIKVLTDIKKDHPTNILKTAILEKTVDSGVLSFIEELKEKKSYQLYKSQNHYNNFISSISENIDCLFIYYTGHSKDGNFILPEGSMFSFIHFRDSLKAQQIILIMDCCEGGLSLPFVLNEGIYRFECESVKESVKETVKETTKETTNTSLIFVKPEIVCISSSLENEKAITSKSGSIFSKHLFTVLKDNSVTVNKLIQEVNSLLKVKQTANVSASYPIHQIFGWLYSFPPLSIKITPLYIEVTLFN